MDTKAQEREQTADKIETRILIFMCSNCIVSTFIPRYLEGAINVEYPAT